MQISKKKTTTLVIAIFLMLSMSASTMLIPFTIAHSPPLNIPTFSFCSISPNPIGVGQTVNVNFWVGEPPPTASGQFGDRWQNMTVVVTHPDGTTEKLGPFTSDATGGSHSTYTPTVVGNYTFQMFFGGQTLAGNNLPAGTPTSGPSANVAIGDYYQPSSSNKFTLIVQQEATEYASVAPLPTTYWTRPIYGENNNWYSIAGNWLGTGQSAFAATGMYNSSVNYNAFTTAPNTAHILWSKPDAFGGVIGGAYGSSETTGNYYATAQYEPKFAPIIMQGILYYTMYPGSGANPSGWAAIDLHTGQTLWTKNTTEVLRCGQILDMITPNQYGALAYLWSQPPQAIITYEGFSLGPSLEMWDAMTGNYILSITGLPSLPPGVPGNLLSLTADDNGDLIGYYVNSSFINAYPPTLNMWNSTACINLAIPNSYGGPNVADNWIWRPTQGAQIPFSLGVEWSAPIATTVSGAPLPATLGISGIDSGVVYMTAASSSGGLFYQPGWEIEAGYSATTGQQLWITNRTEVPYTLISSGAGVGIVGDGVYVEFTQNALSISTYSLFTGKLLWTQNLPNASPFDSLGANQVIANGTIYLWGYGGDVYAYNVADGSLKWQYHTPSGGYESPYGREPLWTFSVGTVADGKLFVPEGHMYSPPLFHNAQQLALNITDGSLVWSIDAFDVTSAPAISDGIATTLNAYDNQIYAWGMGPSKVTVSAPQAAIELGRSLVIEGMVTDISAGAQQQAVSANFPNGLPCVSDASMTPWMEYVYMQQTKPNNVTGVPVVLSVIDANGNQRQIGTAATDASGSFSYQWAPNITGKYTVIATFAGSQSYYGSSSQAAFAVDQASPTTAPIASPLSDTVTNSNMIMYLAVGVIAIIIAIAIVGLLILRKHA
jgi:outer membrane protein assembly factor BamB